jgi:MurNAc alpha-1-phosphate uridylyltransferase
VKALLMAAGLGTRLRPLTERTPKPLLPVRGKPLAHRLIKQLVAAGFTDISINTHHLGAQIEQSIGSGERFGARIRYAPEPELLDTGGTILAALPWLGEAPFLVVNADIFTDFDFARLPAGLAHDLVHMVVTPTPAWRAHGDFEYAGGRVLRRGESHVYCSISVVSPRLFDGAPPPPFSWRELFFAAIERGQAGGQEHLGEWHDIGTLSQYEAVR